MQRIDTISLENTLPAVFVGSENDEPVASSQVWMRQLTFERKSSDSATSGVNCYMVEAESGTGKSSLCAYIYGNRRDYRGRILFDNSDIRMFTIGDWCEIRRRHLAYLPQEMNLFPELTAMENVLIKNRLTDRYAVSEISRMLERLEIEHKSDVIAGRLSVGQQQRVAIIRSLCQPFDFLLLDEPVSHLDARNNVETARLILDVARENEASVITTSVGNPLLLRDFPEKVVSVKL